MDKEKKSKHTKVDRWGEVRTVRVSDITSGMVKVIIVCWLIPFLTISIVLFIFSQANADKRINESITNSLENASVICKYNLDRVVSESKSVSYDRRMATSKYVWYDNPIRLAYLSYMANVQLNIPNGLQQQALEYSTMRNTVTEYLNDKFRYNEFVSACYVVFNENLEKDEKKGAIEYCYTVSKKGGESDEQARSHWRSNNVEVIVNKESENLGTDVKYINVGGKIYMIRNLVKTDYTRFATIALALNSDKIFGSINSIMFNDDYAVYIDGKYINAGISKEDLVERGMSYYRDYSMGKIKCSDYENQVYTGYDDKNCVGQLMFMQDGHEYSVVVMLDKANLKNESSAVIYLYVIIILLLVPLLGATVYYFYTNVSNPIYQLMYGSQKIEDGQYGYRLETFDKNQEFGRLIDTFNAMSTSLKESFEKIYVEEIAVRDANMHALQAQINPHFLNNTLEIINWKARMSGNDDVSGMIESLGIMMEATMNRKNESFISLREEMTYVDAYLYIIDQRFGSRFKFVKEVDDNLLDIRIPRLIIQPLVENMVDHGADINGNRFGELKIFVQDKNLHIVVENMCRMKAEDEKRVEELLGDTNFTSKRKNIGIRNVNMRIKMLYGETSGLTIKSTENDSTISEIVVEMSKINEVMDNQSQNKNN